MFDFLSLVKGLGLLLILEGLWWLAVGTPIWLWIKNRKKSGEDQMADASWVIKGRKRIRKAVKKVVIKKGNEEFTARDIIPRVKKELWSYDRWGISTQRVAQALRQLYLEGFVEKVGLEDRKRYPATIYRAVGIYRE